MKTPIDMQDNAGKTPETPRWQWDVRDIQGDGLWFVLVEPDGTVFVGCDLPGEVGLDLLATKSAEAKVTHLEGALREAEKDRDSWKETAKHTVSASIAETIDDIVSDLRAKLREAEAKAALADKLVEHFDGDMHGDPCDAVIEFLDAMVALQQPRAGS